MKQPKWRTATRYDLCTASGPATLRELRLSAEPLLGVHCGTTAHVLRLQGLRPVRQLSFSIQTLEPETRTSPGWLALADLNADAALDLVISSPFVDAARAPRGGLVHVLWKSARGAFEAPAPWSHGHIQYLIPALAGPDATAASAYHHLISLRDGRRGLGTVLWSQPPMHSAGQRKSAELPPYTRALTHLEADASVLLAGVQEGQHGVWWQRVDGTSPPNTQFHPVGPVSTAAQADLDGDGKHEIVIAGDALFLLDGRDRNAIPQEIPGTRCVSQHPTLPCHRDVQLVDTNRDHLKDIKTFSPPSLQIHKNAGRLQFEATAIEHRLQGDNVAVYAAHLSHLHGESLPELVVLLAPDDRLDQLELAIVGDLDPETVELHFEAGSMPMATSVFATQDSLGGLTAPPIVP